MPIAAATFSTVQISKAQNFVRLLFKTPDGIEDSITFPPDQVVALLTLLAQIPSGDQKMLFDIDRWSIGESGQNKVVLLFRSGTIELGFGMPPHEARQFHEALGIQLEVQTPGSGPHH